MASDNGPWSRADFLTENSIAVYGTVRAKIIEQTCSSFKRKLNILVPKSNVICFYQSWLHLITSRLWNILRNVCIIQWWRILPIHYSSFIAILSFLTNCMFWQFLWNLWYWIIITDYSSSSGGKQSQGKMCPRWYISKCYLDFKISC